MFKGKALLVIDRLEASNSKDFRWDIHPYVQSMNHEDPGNELGELFNCMEYDCIPAPNAAYKMEVGDRIYVVVSFEAHFVRGDGYTSDDDWDFYIIKERVLRRQPYTEKRYRKKFYKFWKTSQPIN